MQKRGLWEVRLTPKALAVEKMRGQGMSFEDALVIADRTYTSDGTELVENVVHQAMEAAGGTVCGGLTEQTGGRA